MRHLIAIFAILISSHAAADTLITTGADCSAIIPNQAKALQWGAPGLLNPSDDKDFFVICPMERQATSVNGSLAPIQWWGGAVVISADNSAAGPQDVLCLRREFVGGTRINQERQTITVRPGSAVAATFKQVQVTNPLLSTFHVVCRMPPRTTVNTLLSSSTATKTNAELNRLVNRLNATQAGG